MMPRDYGLIIGGIAALILVLNANHPDVWTGFFLALGSVPVFVMSTYGYVSMPVSSADLSMKKEFVKVFRAVSYSFLPLIIPLVVFVI